MQVIAAGAVDLRGAEGFLTAQALLRRLHRQALYMKTRSAELRDGVVEVQQETEHLLSLNRRFKPLAQALTRELERRFKSGQLSQSTYRSLRRRIEQIQRNQKVALLMVADPFRRKHPALRGLDLNQITHFIVNNET